MHVALPRVVAGISGCLLVLLVTSTPASAGTTWTLDADFDQGTLVNLNHDFPNNDQLQLNTTTTPFPFLWAACSIRGTVVRIDTETGAVVGEYRTAPQGMGLNPSRTTVDLYGNVWIGNRDEASGGNGSVVKLGLVIGGTRGNKNPDGSFSPDPNGEYVAPPFLYNTCVDRDGDGYIHTSRGLGNIFDWPNITDGAGGVDGVVEDAFDEAILIFQRTSGPNVRHVSIDANNDVWAAGYPYTPTVIDHLDGDTGQILFTRGMPCGGYGGLVDGNGVLWSSAISQNRLLRYDIASDVTTCFTVGGSYGLGIDTNGYIWNAQYLGAGSVSKFAADGTLQPGFPRPTGGANCRGVAVTPIDNDVWVANSGSATVTRLDNDGNLLKIIGVGSTPTGVAVDANGKVWVTNYSSNNVMRIDPAGGGDGLGAVDLTVPLGAGAGPYNYSDMTGIVAAGSTSPQGVWTVVHDAGVAGTEWGTISWNSSEPAGTNIVVSVRAADSVAGLSSQAFLAVGNAVEFLGVQGRYVEIRTVLQRSPSVQDTPILFDLTLDPSECPRFDVVFGESWDGVSLQDVLDAEYGVGAIDAATDYEGYLCGDADPPYWTDEGIDAWLVREIAGYRYKNIFGWYAETFSPPTIDGVGDGVIFDGPVMEGAMATISIPGGVTDFGFYLDPNGLDDAHNAPQPEMFFTNRHYNDPGPDGSDDLRVPEGGDPQCLVYNITHLRGGVPTFVLAWEDLDYGSPITPAFDPNGTDDDFQDLVIEVQALSTVPAVVPTLHARTVDLGVEVRWSLSYASEVDALGIWRQEGDGAAVEVQRWNAGAPIEGSWVDRDVRSGADYYYRVRAVVEGQTVESTLVHARVASSTIAVSHLERAVPNPFNPSTRIEFQLARTERALVRVFDSSGRRVRELDLGIQAAGPGSATWNGRDEAGRTVASGVYLVQLVTATQRDWMRVALIK